MENGGDAIFLMDVQQSSIELTNFNSVLERYNLTVNNDLVLELDQTSYLQDFTIIIPKVNETDVSSSLDPYSLSLYLPQCRSIGILQAEKQWITVKPLFATSEKSQSQNILTGEIKIGPFFIGALSEYEGINVSRVALIGNAQFISDNWMSYRNDNGKRYVLSMLNWMQDQDSSVYIPSKSLASRPIQLTAQSRYIAFISLTFLLPLIIIGFGIFVWIRRKHL